MAKIIVHVDDKGHENWTVDGFPMGKPLDAKLVRITHCPECAKREPGWAETDLTSIRDHVVAEHNMTVAGGAGAAWRGDLLSKDDVLARVPFGQTKLWELIKAGRFPAPTSIAGVSCWYAREVEVALARLASAPNESMRGAGLKTKRTAKRKR